MTRYELERHLGKYVEIVLFDGTVIEGILHKTREKAFLSIPKKIERLERRLEGEN